MTKTTTIDLQDRIDEIRDEEIPSLEESKRDLAREAKEEYGSFEDTPAGYRQAYNEFETDIAELEGEAEALEEFIDQYGGSEFTLRKLTGAQLVRIEDDVSEESYEADPENERFDGVPKTGYYKVLYTRMAIADWPDSCPVTRNGHCDVGEFDGDVFTYLFERVKNLNNAGRVDLGNSSLKEAMQDV